MRRVLLATMVVALLAPPSATAQGRSRQREIKEWFVRKPPAFQEQSWIVVGKRMETRDDAIISALKEARTELTAFLEKQNPPVKWVPDLSFIRRNLLADLPEQDEIPEKEKGDWHNTSVDRHSAFEEVRILQDPVGKTHRVCLKVSVTPESWAKILEEQKNNMARQRNLVMKERMLFLLKIMVGLVALLATVGGYIRLDEWSKGYYTNWLRLAALSCIGAVAAAGWWLFLAN